MGSHAGPRRRTRNRHTTDHSQTVGGVTDDVLLPTYDTTGGERPYRIVGHQRERDSRAADYGRLGKTDEQNETTRVTDSGRPGKSPGKHRSFNQHRNCNCNSSQARTMYIINSCQGGEVGYCPTLLHLGNHEEW